MTEPYSFIKKTCKYWSAHKKQKSAWTIIEYFGPSYLKTIRTKNKKNNKETTSKNEWKNKNKEVQNNG